MQIEKVELKHISIPMVKPFKTALRTVTSAENTVVMITSSDGKVGYGEAPPTKPITGDTNESIIEAIENNISKAIVGMSADPANKDEVNEIMEAIQNSVEGNTSPKAACDMAVYDLLSQEAGMPLYRYLGGEKRTLETDLTVSINSPEEMSEDAQNAINRGFHAVKLKVGIDPELDIKRIMSIRQAIGSRPGIRLDANQGWTDRQQALDMIHWLHSQGVVMVEQPMPKTRLEDIAWITQQSPIPVFADESIQRLADIERIKGAFTGINIKLMKCTGMREAWKMLTTARALGMKVMIGCMTETSCGISAAAQLSPAVDFADLDGNLLISNDRFRGVEVVQGKLCLPHLPGIGVKRIKG